MFENKYVSFYFNEGYNPDANYTPIKKKWHDAILDHLKENSHKVSSDAVAQVKNCSVFNKLFGKQAKKFLSRMKNRIKFKSQYAEGTVNHYGIFLTKNYLYRFLWNMGKQAKEIENGQRKDFDLKPEHFNEAWGTPIVPIKKTIAHEIMHPASGFNGGGRKAECIVHCLTKKCITENPDTYVLKEFRTNREEESDAMRLPINNGNT